MVNDLSAAQFVTINVDWTVTLNDTCAVVAPVESSRMGTQGVCIAGVIFYYRFIILISTNFDNLYRPSNKQSHVFLIFSACLVTVVSVKRDEQLGYKL